MANRWGISKEVEEFVKQRDLQCIYCGISFIDKIFNNKTRPTWEHIINDIRLNQVENIELCCGSCNASKGQKLLIEWLNGKYCVTKNITKYNVAKVVKDYLNRH